MERIRFTVSVPTDVHAAFVEMAKAGGQSLSYCVGEWLADTTEPARFVTGKMRELRMAPGAALAELAVIQDRAAEQTRSLQRQVETRGVAVPGQAGAGGARQAGRRKPPSSPTGVNRMGKPLDTKRGNS